MNNPMMRNFVVWGLIFVALMLLVGSFSQRDTSSYEKVSYSQFLKLIDAGVVDKIEVTGNEIRSTSENGRKIKALAPNDPNLISDLRHQNIDINVLPPEEGNVILQYLLSILPWLLFIGIWVYFMRQMQGGGKGGALSFGKSRAQMSTENEVKVRFGDVAGVDEAKQELTEIVDYLKDPAKFQRLGGRIPKGVLLVGPPGTGKTLLARAVAGEAGVPFFSLSGSDFVEMFVGVGAARVRDLFEQGKKNAPCIIFIDEIDAVGRHRGAGLGGGNDEREQTLNAMLVEMDGFESNEGVILLAATNRPDVLDPALQRPGRFDRQVVVPLPDIQGREHILGVHMKKVPLGSDVNARTIARGTPGFSGADLQNLVNEAALMAARSNKRLVDMADFENAKDKVMMGAERRSSVMTEEQQKTTAYHEAGHAICTLFIDGPHDPLHKVTIIPRGRALGVTMSLPEEDKVNYDKKFLENQIAIFMGGRIAEELVLDQQTTGASNDIERATDIARKMVCSWGMSKLGPINYGQNESEVFLGRDLGHRKELADDTAKLVDAEVQAFVQNGYDRCEAILKKHLKELHVLSEGLLVHETLDAEQIDDLLAGKEIRSKEPVRRKAAKKADTSKEKSQEKKETKTKAKKPRSKSDTKKS
ncbi:MAG: ATP-dependent zinc metalloprotease FtsH [Alphaproteobacteria bacterium]|nr:ATP-dependent zinc metalloprotease FtsH [Alphaproteobacteria bacterium]MDD9919492.1 ATP-dependent zinc metalloprotease FtsH [Alphaproteobacteria bacterium]